MPAATEWRFIDDAEGEHVVPVAGRFEANDVKALVAAALDGAGIVLAPEVAVRNDLAAGRLVRLLNGYEAPRGPCTLCFRRAASRRSCARSSTRWLRSLGRLALEDLKRARTHCGHRGAMGWRWPFTRPHIEWTECAPARSPEYASKNRPSVQSPAGAPTLPGKPPISLHCPRESSALPALGAAQGKIRVLRARSAAGREAIAHRPPPRRAPSNIARRRPCRPVACGALRTARPLTEHLRSIYD
ncbi:LysR substrate-binding domain-containing protein [Paraburkholderia kirstenboschensis]|uniref:LysR substrate-binding domain-containing protein n=1 Tax=Paraburkholderia kirstenboschensis TaxID=1245436 RepID=UPI003C786878